MANETITYSSSVQGWTSFWSYIPEYMIGMNSAFFTFKNGSMYEHNSNQTRNNFYGTQYESSVTTIFNQGNTETKMFKTLELDSNTPWTATVTTDLDNGLIDSTFFAEKEGGWFAYIRRPDNGSYDVKAISTQGVGEANTVSTPVPNFISFSFNISSSVAVGDRVYKQNGGSLQYLGDVLSHGLRNIRLTNLQIGVAAVSGDLIMIVKNSQAESFGSRGYYMEVKLDNTDTTEVELFAVATQTFKSYP
jgi:hypothetical protein